jgi:flagellar biosynthetic protein FliR
MQSALDLFLATQLFAFLLIFARLGCAMMVMPGLGDVTVPMDVRLYFVLSFSLVMAPFLYKFLPAIPNNPTDFALLVIKEMLIGFFIGLMSQIMINAVNLAGFIVAHVTSLSSAFTFNPQQAAQSAIVTSFLSLLTVIMIFITDLHHLLFIGLIDSYRLFVPGDALMMGDMANGIAEGLSKSFVIGLQIAAPFIIVGFGVFLAMGLVSRLVPQIQVFILSMPIQILVGLTLLATCMSALMLFFLQQYEDFWTGLFTG